MNSAVWHCLMGPRSIRSRACSELCVYALLGLMPKCTTDILFSHDAASLTLRPCYITCRPTLSPYWQMIAFRPLLLQPPLPLPLPLRQLPQQRLLLPLPL
jgi:hypothetical protein